MSLVPPETLIAQRAMREARRLADTRREAGERLRRPAEQVEIIAALRSMRDEREAMSERIRRRNNTLRRRVGSFRWRMIMRMSLLGGGIAVLGAILDFWWFR